MTSATTNPSSDSKPSVYLQDAKELQSVFQRFDTNGDGKISADELTGVMKALGSNTSPEEVSRMMEDIDADKDGFINLQEFADFCKAETDPFAAADGGLRELQEAFGLYDQDHNGLISSAELHKILTRLGEHCTIEDCEKMIHSVDSDGDGFVNFEEFKKMMTNTKKSGEDEEK